MFLRKSEPATGQHRFDSGLREATYPAPYPSGWYAVGEVEALRAGEAKALDCLGKHFVLYRGRSGKAVLLDAHCPHQGASLAGGEVCGDQIECPFHRWRFSEDGALASIPGLDKKPRTGVRAYPLVERFGLIWTYHDISGEPVEPPYPMHQEADLEAGALRYRGTYEPPDVRMHLAEFAENSVDFQHFAAIHGELTVPWTQLKVPGMGVRHEPSWEVDEEHPHIAYFCNFACLVAFGRALPESGAHARITLFGPGGAVFFRFTLPGLGDILLVQTHLPLDPLRQQIRFRWYAEPKISRLLVWWVVGHWISQWKADIGIWESKVFRERPVLVSLDGPVHRMRRWYQQFYEPTHTPASKKGRHLPVRR